MKHHFVYAGAFSLFACGGSALDVGSNQGGGPSSAEGGADSGGRSTTPGGNATSGVASSGAGADDTAGGSFASGGATMAFGGQAAGARSGAGGQANGAGGQMLSLGGQVTGASGQGQAAAGGQMVAAGGRGQAVGGQGQGAAGGMAAIGGAAVGASGSPNTPLVAQTCNSKISQIWEGSTLDFFFNPQDDRWRIEFDGAGPNGRVCGTATYIAAGQEPPPPATDPDASYPPSWDPNTVNAGGLLVPGATYSIIQGAEVGGVLRFRIATNELWQGWCALQTPVPHPNGYTCVDPTWTSDGVTCTTMSADGTAHSYPYGKCLLCRAPGVCSCDATRCVAGDGESVVFDLKLDGDQMTGTVGSSMINLILGM